MKNVQKNIFLGCNTPCFVLDLDTEGKFIDIQIDLIPKIACVFPSVAKKPFQPEKQKSFFTPVVPLFLRAAKIKRRKQNLPAKLRSWLFKLKSRKFI